MLKVGAALPDDEMRGSKWGCRHTGVEYSSLTSLKSSRISVSCVDVPANKSVFICSRALGSQKLVCGSLVRAESFVLAADARTARQMIMNSAVAVVFLFTS